MGCDIHFFTERKTSDNNYQGPKDLSEDRNTKIEEIIDGLPVTERWVSADTWMKDGEGWTYNDFYWQRNYYLFSILADVRNDGSVEPLSDCRGIPNDASSGYRYMTKRWEGDAHSHSYFTLKELLDVDWNKYETEHLQDFFKVLELLKNIDNDTEKVRICFFFDN